MDMRPPPRAADSGHYEAASDCGGQRAAAIYTLIGTAKLNDVDPQAWLADVLARIAEHPVHRIRR
jgi:transposase